MGLTYSDLQIHKNTSAWTTTGGIHVIALQPTLGTVVGQHQPPAPFYLFEGDNNANAKYISRPTPNDGANPGVSTYWECWFRLPDPTAQELWFIVANQQTIQVADANIRGYGVYLTNIGGGAAPVVTLYRLTGGGGLVEIGNSGGTMNANTLYRVRISREVSGANRFWRVYYNDLVTPVFGPTNDATYTNFSYWGWDHLTYARMMCGGESCRS